MKITKTITLLLSVALLLAACSSDNGTDNKNNPGSQNSDGSQNSPGSQNNQTSRPPTVVEDLTKPLEGELTVMASLWNAREIRVYARLFNELPPGVNVDVEVYEWAEDAASHMALTTRLLADPPDVFVAHSDLTFEKKSVEVLFADLYGFPGFSKHPEQNRTVYIRVSLVSVVLGQTGKAARITGRLRHIEVKYWSGIISGSLPNACPALKNG